MPIRHVRGEVVIPDMTAQLFKFIATGHGPKNCAQSHGTAPPCDREGIPYPNPSVHPRVGDSRYPRLR